MNKTEEAYAAVLEQRRVAGEVFSYAYELVKIRLAKKTFLTIDFFVVLTDGTIEFHEVKGFMEDDAAVKLKVAAEIFPARIFVITKRAQKDGGGFNIRQVGEKPNA